MEGRSRGGVREYAGGEVVVVVVVGSRRWGGAGGEKVESEVGIGRGWVRLRAQIVGQI